MGRPKAWLPFGPETLLQRVVRLVSAAASPLVVVAAPDQSLPDLPLDVLIVRDPIPDRGPLQGLAAGLSALPPSVEFAYATATDSPFLRPAWIDHLALRIGPHDLAIPFANNFHHPLAALYRPCAVLPAIEQLLAANDLRPRSLLPLVRSLVLPADDFLSVDPHLDTLHNLNTPSDYSLALSRLGLDPPPLSE